MVQLLTARLDASFAAFSDATRRGVLEELGGRDASITELADKFYMRRLVVLALNPAASDSAVSAFGIKPTTDRSSEVRFGSSLNVRSVSDPAPAAIYRCQRFGIA
jgi:hypothetical protein